MEPSTIRNAAFALLAPVLAAVHAHAGPGGTTLTREVPFDVHGGSLHLQASIHLFDNGNADGVIRDVPVETILSSGETLVVLAAENEERSLIASPHPGCK